MTFVMYSNKFLEVCFSTCPHSIDLFCSMMSPQLCVCPFLSGPMSPPMCVFLAYPEFFSFYFFPYIRHEAVNFSFISLQANILLFIYVIFSTPAMLYSALCSEGMIHSIFKKRRVHFVQVFGNNTGNKKHISYVSIIIV